MLISYFRILICCSFALMRTKLIKKLDRNLPKITEEEDLVSVWKFYCGS